MRKILAALLLFLPGVAHAGWLEATTKHFIIYSDDTAPQISHFALSLERYDKAMRVFRKIPDNPVSPSERVTIFVTQSESAIAALGEPGALGFYKAIAGRPVAFTIKKGDREWTPGTHSGDEWALSPEIVLHHEYAHHFMFTNWDSAALPIWFTEGFAEFHATAVEEKNGSIVFGAQPGYRLGNFAYGELCSPKQILLADDLVNLLLHSGCDYSDLYAWGWLLTDYMAFSPGGPEAMAAYVAALNSGKSSREAAAAFGDLDKLDKTLAKYLDQKKLPAFTVVAGDLQIAPPIVRAVSPGEAATMELRMRTNAGVEKKAARGVYEDAVRAAQPYPIDPAAQLELSEAAYVADAFDEAEAAARRVLAADPKSTDAMIDVGRAKMGKAIAAKSTDKQVWREVRQWFADANRSDTSNPEPLILYYRSFIAAGQPASANALGGLYQAADIAPYARNIGFLTGYAYLSENRPADARKALALVAYDPDWPKIRERAAKMLKMIDDGQPAAAMDALLPWVKDPNYVEPKPNKKVN